MNQSIKSWPEQERPRERLLQQGAQSLSDAELLAIFLRSGSRQHSAVELARLMLRHFGGLNAIFDASKAELCQFHGMGHTKYAQLMAVKELGRRYTSYYLVQDQITLDSSALVLNYLRYELQSEKQEIFAVLCLDSQLRKLHFKKLFFGATNYCNVSIQQTLRYAISQHASFIIVAHNHPFAPAKPSDADITMTAQLKQACQYVEIQLLDHIIIGTQDSYSFAQHRLLESAS